MAVDLREQIAQVLSPDVARQLASTVGLDDGQGKSFVDAAIPALLGAFASHPQGAKALSDAVGNADPNLLDRLRSALTARDLGPLNEGADALTPVIGQAARDKIANTLADKFGVPVEAITPALGAVEQAAIGVIGQQDPSLWSDGASLLGLLTGGAAAGGAMASAAAPSPPPPPAAAPSRAPTPPPPPPPQPQSGGGSMWIVVLIILIIAAVAAWYWWSHTRPEAKTGFDTPSTQTAWLAPPDHLA